MKFLIISNLYEPYARGGAEAVVKMTAEGLVTRGHEVVVVTARPPSPLPSPLEGEGKIKIFRFFPLNLYFVRDDWRYPVMIRFIWRLIDIFNLQAAWAIGQAIKKEKPDVVVTHNLVGIGMLTPWAIRRNRVRHIHVLHDVQLVHPSGLLIWGQEARAERNQFRRIYERLMRYLFGSPDIVIAPSRWLLDFYTSRGFFRKSKQVVLPNPVVISPSMSNVKCQMSNVKCNLLYAGQLEPHKGVAWLLKVVYSLQSTVYSLVLEIAGSGSLEREVRAAAEKDPEYIIFHGKLSPEELFKKFQEVDALVVPSLCYENAPQIISEALSVGLPVIASRIGGIPELIRGGDNGFLFRPSSVTEFKIELSKLQAARLPPTALTMSLDQYLDNLLKLC